MFLLARVSRWFRDRARKIYHYHDGTSWHRADPIAVGVALDQVCPDYQDALDAIGRKTEALAPGPARDDMLRQKDTGIKKITAAARVVFDLKTLSDTGGLTDAEAIAVLTGYFNFMERLARDAQLFTTSPGVA